MNIKHVPIEISIGGIYFPPILFAMLTAALLTFCLGTVLNRLKWIQFIWYPPLFFLAIFVIFIWLIGISFIPF